MKAGEQPERQRDAVYDAAVRRWEYPETVEVADVDRGVTAVLEALRGLDWSPRGLPGEVLPLRAIVGLVLADQHARGLRAVQNGEHVLHRREGDWVMEHTVECRLRGLMLCPLGELAMSGAWAEVEPGDYRIVDEVPVRLERL